MSSVQRSEEKKGKRGTSPETLILTHNLTPWTRKGTQNATNEEEEGEELTQVRLAEKSSICLVGDGSLPEMAWEERMGIKACTLISLRTKESGRGSLPSSELKTEGNEGRGALLLAPAARGRKQGKEEKKGSTVVLLEAAARP